MPENELAIPYTEVKRLVKQYGNAQALKRLQDAIESDTAGVVFGYRKGRFIKKVWS